MVVNYSLRQKYVVYILDTDAVDACLKQTTLIDVMSKYAGRTIRFEFQPKLEFIKELIGRYPDIFVKVGSKE